jgi:hypothetical protein
VFLRDIPYTRSKHVRSLLGARCVFHSFFITNKSPLE